MGIVAVVLALVVRPPVGRPGARWLDVALVAYLFFVAIQLIPITPALRLGVSPALRGVDLRLRLDAPAVPLADTPHPLTVDASGTMESLLLSVSAILTFWMARVLFTRGGLRLTARTIAGLGLVLASFGLAQHVTAPHMYYWVRRIRATPFGPFLNHSDFATWIVMALAVSAGYLIARWQAQASRSHGRDAADAFDNVAMWLTTAIGLMAASIVVALSRSGLIALVTTGLSLIALSKGRLRGGRLWLAGGVVACVGLALAYADTSALSARVQETVDLGLNGRAAIWRATVPMIKDFWLTGVGAGAYERGMMVYQPAPHVTYFNHAHNEYLQLMSEGGLWLAIPGLLAIAAGVSSIWKRLSADRTPIYWVRAGAVSGMAAVAVQSIWETGLRRPANLLLFAVLAAIAMHSAAEPSRRTADYPEDVRDRQ